MLEIGWIKAGVVESAWIDDPAYGEVPQAAREAWRKDGAAVHLAPYLKPGASPTRVRYRTLTAAEAMDCQAAMTATSMNADDWTLGFLTGRSRAWLVAFQRGVDLPDLPADAPKSTAAGLHDDVMAGLVRDRLAMVTFFGRLIFEAATVSEHEKKASSQPSTPKPSENSTSAEPPAQTAPAAAATAVTTS